LRLIQIFVASVLVSIQCTKFLPVVVSFRMSSIQHKAESFQEVGKSKFMIKQRAMCYKYYWTSWNIRWISRISFLSRSVSTITHNRL